jgi:hypothetical protein
LSLLCHFDELDEEVVGWQILFEIEAKEGAREILLHVAVIII